MESQAVTFTKMQPRQLLHRKHYQWYARFIWMGVSLAIFYISLTCYYQSWARVEQELYLEFCLLVSYLIVAPVVYIFFLRPKFSRSVQVFEDHLMICKEGNKDQVLYQDIVEVKIFFRSIFGLKMKSGHLYYFSCSLERIDYVWEGLYMARPDLFSPEVFESFRLKLVQYDHHQKRKEWFFQHRMTDVLSWMVVPAILLMMAYQYQSNHVQIHFEMLYFFRLVMYLLLIGIFLSFFSAFVMKKFIFDKWLEKQITVSGEKHRDIHLEESIVERAKYFQMGGLAFIFLGMIVSQLNLFSLTKLKQDVTAFGLKKGNTIVVDNRYNCVSCKFAVRDGDVILFGKGSVGQVIAMPGEVIAQTGPGTLGRTIASETVTEVPDGHVAIKIGDRDNQVVMIQISDLIGKLKNQ